MTKFKDGINHGFVGIREPDYEWLGQKIGEVANVCCGGRVISVLEGGYAVQVRPSSSVSIFFFFFFFFFSSPSSFLSLSLLPFYNTHFRVLSFFFVRYHYFLT